MVRIHQGAAQKATQAMRRASVPNADCGSHQKLSRQDGQRTPKFCRQRRLLHDQLKTRCFEALDHGQSDEKQTSNTRFNSDHLNEDGIHLFCYAFMSTL